MKLIQWPTRHAAHPVTNVDPRWLALFRTGLTASGERGAVQLSGAAGQILGLNQAQAAKLQKLLTPRYELIAQDAAFKDPPTALPYCFSERTPSHGLATVYLPAKVNTNKAPILFLHGYGGSFLWPVHLLAEAFPDRIIIAPAFGLSCGNVSVFYLHEALKATGELPEVNATLDKPILVGLSAGGFGALAVYTPRPEAFQGLLCLAAYPENNIIPIYRAAHRVEFICGEQEMFARNGILPGRAEKMKARGAQIGYHTAKDGDHFFMVEFPDESKRLMKEAVAHLEKKE